MIRLLAFGFGPFPDFPASPAQEVLATLQSEAWAPPQTCLKMVVAPCRWSGAVEWLHRAVQEETPDALVLIGVRPNGRAIAAVDAAVNRAEPAADQAGMYWPGRTLAPGGPERLKATLAPEPLAAAMGEGGAPAEVAREGGGYVFNRCFYAALSAPRAPPAGMILLPLPIETARACSVASIATLNRVQLVGAVQRGLAQAALLAQAQLASERSERAPSR